MAGPGTRGGRLVVRKFGGTSVGSADAMRRVAEIVEREPCMIVLSAMSGVTGALLDMVAAAALGDQARVGDVWQSLARRHHETASAVLGEDDADLPVGREIDGLLEEARTLCKGVLLLHEATHRTRDAVASVGERLATAIFSAYQGHRAVPHRRVDARSWLLTDDGFGAARPCTAALPERVRPVVEAWGEGLQVITEGFIGATDDGLTTTLGRGGSDYTAALLASAAGAAAIEIWTDVTGVMTADPRLVPGARPVPRLTYAEAAELAYFGAKVLHPATVRPAVERGIPVVVLDSTKPSAPGTTIDAAGDAAHPVKALTIKAGVVLVTIESDRMLGAHGFLRAIFEAFDRSGISVDVVATAEVSVTVSLEPHPALPACCAELARTGKVTVAEGRSVIAVIGEGIKATPGIGARVFGALTGVNVELISMGASRLNLSLVVKDEDRSPAASRIHRVLFED
jgi:aspartate kinase